MQRLMVQVLAWLTIGLLAVGTSPGLGAAESDSPSRQTRPASHSTSPVKRLPTYASTSALVQDLRVSQEKESFRLVLHLDRKIRVTQSREKDSGKLILDFLNTKLTKTAAEKLVQATMLPQAVRITLQQQPSFLRLSLNRKAVSRFNYFILGTPNRFVLDFTPVQAPPRYLTRRLPPLRRTLAQHRLPQRRPSSRRPQHLRPLQPLPGGRPSRFERS